MCTKECGLGGGGGRERKSQLEGVHVVVNVGKHYFSIPIVWFN